jgi:histone deacetylase HOS3
MRRTDECYKHRYIRSKDVTWIVERPERLRALKVGFAAAIARLEEDKSRLYEKTEPDVDASDELASALDKLSIAVNPAAGITDICEIIRLPVNLQYLSSDAAVRMVHAANATGDGYDNMEHLHRLAKWARESEDRIKRGECEIPEGFPQNDLYSEDIHFSSNVRFITSCL